MSDLTAGDAAPDFDLPRDGGGRISLSSLKGKPVVVYFYPKDDTTGCTKEAISFTALLPDFDKAGAAIVGISPDPVSKHDKFVKKHSLSVTLASDEDNAVATLYGVWKEKSMYGKSYMGIERSTFLVGPDGRIAKIWSKVKVDGHAEDVLQSVRQL